MPTASLTELKKELLHLPASKVLEICMRLAKHKKENKELVNYLLFDANDEPTFIENIKAVIVSDFDSMNKSQVYLAKKTLRKSLRTINKYIRFSGSDTVAVSLLMFFCSKLKASGLPLDSNTVLGNMYAQQLKNIHKALEKMHEDLQFDYGKELARLVIDR